MQYRSEVRESQIRNLRQLVEDRRYGKYLLEMTLHRLRAFQGTPIRFRFPVTALIGPNGGGKSTILGAAALIYRDAKPSQFFAVSSADKEAMTGVKVTYGVLDRTERREGEIERSVTYPKNKWTRQPLSRKLMFFGVKGTIPAMERSEFTKYRTGTTPLTEEDYANLDPAVLEHAERILGIDLSRYARSKGKKPLIGYVGNAKFSEFHFGAGISVVIEYVWNLEALEREDQALILIEEVESTLHPYAVRRFVEYLVGVAERKRCQIIFTTHSEYALDPLPPDAIWAARAGMLVNGKMRVQDVLEFRGDVETRLAVYCEDITSKDWLIGMMRYAGFDDELRQVEFYNVGGHDNVVQLTRNHNHDPSRRFKAVGFVDGDARDEIEEGNCVYPLPGDFMPEEVLVDAIREGYSENLAILTVALNRRPDEQEMVKREVEAEARSTEDMHLIFSKIGQRLGFVPEETVRLALISAYCHTCPEEVKRIANLIRHRVTLNGENGNPPK